MLDPFPSRLIRFVEQLPDDPKTIPTPTPQEEPSAKRRKLDSSRNYLSVAKAKLSFSRHRDDDTNEGLLIERRNVGMHARIIPSEAAITFSSLRKASSNFSPLQISMSPCIDEDARQIVRISKLRSYDGAPGAIWSTVDVKAEHQGNHTTMTITYSLFWNETLSPFSGLRTASHRDAAVDIIKTFYPVAERPTAAQSPLDFYEAAFVPPKDDVSSTIEIPGLEASLFPYQKRTLQWLLNREGVRWSSESRGLQELSSAGPAPVTESSREVQDAHGQKFYLNDAFQTVSSDMSNYYHAERAARGGILAEEMGLGKTLEILGLILLHTRENSKSVSNVAVLPDQVPSNATLIVTPESLRRQWMAELSRHAPNLHFEFYQGCKRTSDEDMKVVQKLAACDVVITTYSILSAELHFTNDPPERSRRQERKYKRLKSPLVQISWWRLCLDEAQMVENGFSQAATVARVIPRVNAWGITGTPARDDIDGLFGLLRFLRYEPLCSAQRVWRYIISDQRPVFQKLFNSLALRHTKAMVRDEIALPPQRRYTISIPFTAVEEQHYQSIFKEMADACGLDTHGDPVVEDWTPDKYEEEMRIWLNRLRQTALHPEVGSYNRRVLGQNKTRPMRTVDEVLDAMLYQSENTIRTEERALLSNQLIRGQLLENSPRVKEALEIWKTVRAQTYRLVSEARAELETVLREHQENNETPKRIRDIENSSESDEDDLEEESKGRVGECRRKLRSALEMQHKAVFFCANAYFQIRDNGDMTTPDSEEFHRLKTLEERGYEEAKAIRREILKESHRKANRLMTRVMRKASQQVFTEISELVAKPEQGIESGSIVEGLEELYDELNEQANVIDEWREHVVQLLLKTLLDQEDDVETTGEELGEAAKIQDELMVYVQVLRATIADRQDAMTGQMNELVKYETQTSMRMAKNEEGPAPAKLLELFEVRQRIKPQMSRTSMRGAISEFRSLMSRLGNDKSQTQRAALEHRIAQGQLQATLAALSAQTKVVTSLESELEDFTMTMNARLEYYRQLQSVSDSVLPYDGARTEEAVAKSMDLEKTLQRKLASAQAKHRYRE
jgi:E3 ubiquitin-protein ligase SHPRH